MIEGSRRPLPRPDDDLVAEFWEQCSKGALSFQRCDGCGAWRHLPRVLCAACASSRWTWTPSSGRAKLFSWTVTHFAVIKGFPDPPPYAVAVVEMEEGVRLVSELRGVVLEDLVLDLPLEAVLEDVAEGVKLPFFRRRSS